MFPRLWEASGLTQAQIVDELVSLALERHSQRRRDTGR
jgi:D-alanine-D-alanine ligase